MELFDPSINVGYPGARNRFLQESGTLKVTLQRAVTGRTITQRIGLVIALIVVLHRPALAEPNRDLLFLIGHPDNHAAEFGLTAPGEGYQTYPRKFNRSVSYTVGESDAREWPYIHPAPMDLWAGGRVHPFEIRFDSPQAQDRPLYLVLGLAGGAPVKRSQVIVTVNGMDLPGQTAPSGDPRVCFHPTGPGKSDAILFEIPAGSVNEGQNLITIRLEAKSWIIYDYVTLHAENRPLAITTPPEPDLLAELRAGPAAGVDDIVFAARALGEDPHWYANFGYTLDHSQWKTYGRGGRLCRLNLVTGEMTALVDDPRGGVRDPQVHYDGQKILFSYRREDEPHYHLFEINADGTDLVQLTDGPFDDLEPTYLPDGRIMFVSSRCNRVVNCHTTDVAVLHCCDADGSNLRVLSANNEHDNTPWVMNDGQVLYTRWEYVDRSQVTFHHLWVTSPDGQRQTVFYGNMHPGTTMIDAKPIPGSRKIVASFSPGHGRREHDGVVTVVDPTCGPDDQGSARAINPSADFRDPWGFSEDAFMAATGPQLVLMNGQGKTQVLFQLPQADVDAGLQCHEPRPLCARPREAVAPEQVDWSEPTGRLVLADIYEGRNMEGVQRGEIKKLLVLEALPKPMNYTGGMEPISYGGTFNLERILGTVPIEPDGSAYLELPALRGLFFVALDENDMSVKRMQSFVSVMPGETTGCVGCHEQRTRTPLARAGELMALRGTPQKITPLDDVPEISDYPRDVQPILDRHCLTCHDYDRREGGVVLTGDRGPMFSISYYTMTALNLVADGRNGSGNRPPRSIGSSASRLMKLIDGSHYDVKLSEHERTMIRLWIDTGAAYPGTYAALGTGMIGRFEIVDRSIRLDRSDTEWPSMKASMEALRRRCSGCHREERPLPLSPSHIVGPGAWGSAIQGSGPWVDLTPDDIRRRWTRHLLYNLSRPEKSLLLLAPLSKAAGGYESCGQAVFTDTSDPDYQRILAAVRDTKARLDEIKRFDMPGFRPRVEYVREMQRYGILPADLPPNQPIDVYATEQAFWQSHWHRANDQSPP